MFADCHGKGTVFEEFSAVGFLIENTQILTFPFKETQLNHKFLERGPETDDTEKKVGYGSNY